EIVASGPDLAQDQLCGRFAAACDAVHGYTIALAELVDIANDRSGRAGGGERISKAGPPGRPALRAPPSNVESGDPPAGSLGQDHRKIGPMSRDRRTRHRHQDLQRPMDL